MNLLWAGQYPAYKTASEHMDVVSLNFWTFVFAILLLLPFLLRERARSGWRRGLSGEEIGEFIILGLGGILPPSILLAWGIAHSSASNAAIISLTIPVMMVVMAAIMLGEKITGLRWLSIGMAIVGTSLISKIDWGGDIFGPGLFVGNLVIFVAGAGSAFYNTFSKKLLARFSELEVLVYSYVVGCVVCAILALASGGHELYRVSGYTAATWIAILILGGLPWGLAMVLWMWVLKRLEVGQISTSIYLLPLFGVLLSAITIGEQITLRQVGGGFLVFLGTYLTVDFETRRAVPKAVESPGVGERLS